MDQKTWRALVEISPCFLTGICSRMCYLEDQLICHSEGPVQFPCQVVDLFLQLLGVWQNLLKRTAKSCYTQQTVAIFHQLLKKSQHSIDYTWYCNYNVIVHVYHYDISMYRITDSVMGSYTPLAPTQDTHWLSIIIVGRFLALVFHI